MTEIEYITQEEYNKRKDGPLVCNICGAPQKTPHCIIRHADHDLRQSNPTYNGALGMVCPCPQCTIH